MTAHQGQPAREPKNACVQGGVGSEDRRGSPRRVRETTRPRRARSEYRVSRVPLSVCVHHTTALFFFSSMSALNHPVPRTSTFVRPTAHVYGNAQFASWASIMRCCDLGGREPSRETVASRLDQVQDNREQKSEAASKRSGDRVVGCCGARARRHRSGARPGTGAHGGRRGARHIHPKRLVPKYTVPTHRSRAPSVVGVRPSTTSPKGAAPPPHHHPSPCLGVVERARDRAGELKQESKARVVVLTDDKDANENDETTREAPHNHQATFQRRRQKPKRQAPRLQVLSARRRRR
jgi:hypothetical protein